MSTVPVTPPPTGAAADRSTPSVALVHERFTDYAGSEMVVEQLSRVFPDARVLAPVTRTENLPPALAGRLVPGSLTRFTTSSGGYAHLLPLLPVAMSRLAVPEVDVVVASHHAFATQVVRATRAPVVAYVHSPARWMWEARMRRGEAGRVGGAGLAAFSAAYRPLDRRAAARVHTLVGNSQAVAERIRRWWGREAVVVHPPVDIAAYTPDESVEREDFFLMAGRLVPYKRPELAVRAAAEAGVRLVVAGDGRARAECERVAGPGTTFLGRVSDEEQRDLYRRCRALLMPAVEDFGIVPVEAQACGAPVVGAAEGGSLDTVRDGVTGVLVGNEESGLLGRWTKALATFEGDRYDPADARRHAETFSREAFRTRMENVVVAVAGGAAPSGQPPVR